MQDTIGGEEINNGQNKLQNAKERMCSVQPPSVGSARRPVTCTPETCDVTTACCVIIILSTLRSRILESRYMYEHFAAR